MILNRSIKYGERLIYFLNLILIKKTIPILKESLQK